MIKKFAIPIIIIILMLFNSPLSAQIFGEEGERQNIHFGFYGNLVKLANLAPFETWLEKSSEFGFEVSKRIVKRLYLGFSIGYRNSTWGNLGIISEIVPPFQYPTAQIMNRDLNFKSNLFPLSIFISYRILDSKLVHLYVKGGGLWLWGKVKTVEDIYSGSFGVGSPPDVSVYAYEYHAWGNASMSRWGAQLGIEAEIKMSARVSLVMGLCQRLISTDPLKGTKDWNETIWKDNGKYQENSGTLSEQTLWFYRTEIEFQNQLIGNESVIFLDQKPEWASEASALNLNINNLVLKFGIRLKL